MAGGGTECGRVPLIIIKVKVETKNHLYRSRDTERADPKWFFYAESWTGHLQPSHILCLGSGHLVSGPGEEESLKKYLLLRRDGRRRPRQKYDISIPDDQAGPLTRIGDWKTHISSHYTNK